MLDVSEKAVTKRVAVAKGSIRMSRECFDKIKYQDMKKGDGSADRSTDFAPYHL